MSGVKPTGSNVATTTGNSRRPFTKDEDDRLRQVVKMLGTNQWPSVALMMQNRTARQCRERYRNYLDPTIKNHTWTLEEEILLHRKINELGFKWTQIANFFPNRSIINLKNHWAQLERNANSPVSLRQLFPQMPTHVKKTRRTSKPSNDVKLEDFQVPASDCVDQMNFDILASSPIDINIIPYAGNWDFFE